MNMSISQGDQAPSFAMTGQIPDGSETNLSDSESAPDRMGQDYQTWNWTEAAAEININESTLRKVWWEKKLEPAFLHCPDPLRVTTRTTGSGRQIAEFTAGGIKVLKAYKAALTQGDRAAEVFLATARAKYPALQTPDPVPLAETEPASQQTHAVTVDSGTTVIVTAPELPQIYSLETFQTTESIELDDPLALAAQIVQAVDHVQTAVQQDIDRKQQKLNDTRKAKDLVTARVQELKLEQRFYREKNTQISTAQTEDTQALQDLAALLQKLGKPSAPATSSVG